MNTLNFSSKFKTLTSTELNQIDGGKAWYKHVGDAIGSFFNGFFHGL